MTINSRPINTGVPVNGNGQLDADQENAPGSISGQDDDALERKMERMAEEEILRLDGDDIVELVLAAVRGLEELSWI